MKPAKSKRIAAKRKRQKQLSVTTAGGFVYLTVRRREKIGWTTTLVKITSMQADELADALKLAVACARREIRLKKGEGKF